MRRGLGGTFLGRSTLPGISKSRSLVCLICICRSPGRVASFGSIPHLFFGTEECIIADSWKGTWPMAIIRLGEEALRGTVGNKGRK